MNDSDKNLEEKDNNLTKEAESVKAEEAADNSIAASTTSDNDASLDSQGNPSNEESPEEDIEIIHADSITDSDFTYSEDDESGKKPRRKLTRGDIIRYIIMAIAAIVFIVCVALIVKQQVQYKISQKIDNSVKEEVGFTESESTTSYSSDNGETYDNLKLSNSFDYDKLIEANANGVGWVSVPSVGIEYPIVQGTDNSFYLDHAYTDAFSWSGAIFLDYKNNIDLSDAHNIIYGHHMYDGSMFAGLLEYDNESFYKDHADDNYFYIYLKDTVEAYSIFAVTDVTFAENREMYSVDIPGRYSMEEYVGFIDSLKLYDTGVTASGDDKVVTLYTCQEDSSSKVRHMVHGKLIGTFDRETLKPIQ